MQTRSSMHGATIDAYIVSTWDEHLNEDISDHDKRIQFISGFTGKFAYVVITKHTVALWADAKYLAQANSELSCDWKIFPLHSSPSVMDYLMVRNDTASFHMHFTFANSIPFNSMSFQSIAIVQQIRKPYRTKFGWNGKPNCN